MKTQRIEARALCVDHVLVDGSVVTQLLGWVGFNLSFSCKRPDGTGYSFCTKPSSKVSIRKTG